MTDFSLRVRIVGNPRKGTPILAMPGGPGLSYHYLMGLEALAKPGQAFVSFNPRGVGGSTEPKRPPTLEELSGDIDAIRAALGADRIILLGHSASGLNAMDFATRYPDRLAGLILIDSAPPTEKQMAESYKLWIARIAAFKARGILPKEIPEAPPGGDCRPGLELVAPVWYADPAKAGKLGDTACINDAGERFDASRDWDLTAALGKVTLPVLVVAPLGSPFGTEMAASGRKALTHAKVTDAKLPGCGHIPWVECPEPFFASVQGFIDGLPKNR